jgi:hypothetical protein
VLNVYEEMVKKPCRWEPARLLTHSQLPVGNSQLRTASGEAPRGSGVGRGSWGHPLPPWGFVRGVCGSTVFPGAASTDMMGVFPGLTEQPRGEW